MRGSWVAMALVAAGLVGAGLAAAGLAAAGAGPQGQVVSEATPEEAAPAAALVCTVEEWGGEPPVWVIWVIGGVIEERAWVDSDEVKVLMHEGEELSGRRAMEGRIRPEENLLMQKGDRLTVYALESGVVGEAVLTNDGEIYAGVEGLHGIRFEAKVEMREGGGARGARKMPCPWTDDPAWMLERSLLASWSRDCKEPRWIRGETLDPNGKVYRGIVEGWLKERGVPDEVLGKVMIQQIVRADFDGDKQQEVFLSFLTPEVVWPSDERREHVFSYLLMRDLDRASGEVRTVEMAGGSREQRFTSGYTFWVDGFCDVDRDGRAEVIVHAAYYEGEGVDLYRWDGKTFEVESGSVCAP